MKTKFAATLLFALLVARVNAVTYNQLFVPPTLSGTNFNLSLNVTNKSFFAGTTTLTYAYNTNNFWGPTLIMNQGDTVQINLTNNLAETTTTHWHGFHIPGIMDGGPHEEIPAGSVWYPSFTISNHASLYWYHPHLHPQVQEQLSRGAGGFIIIQDPVESALALPRTYGVDDFPLALTSRRFTTNGSTLTIVTSNSAYGDYELVNGTANAEVTLPQQFVRLRILNAEIERTYNLGFSDNRNFYVIGTDGGLLNAPILTNRVVLGVAERMQILVNLSTNTLGSTVDLMAYNSVASLGGSGTSGLQYGFPGGENSTSGQFGSLLNDVNFTILHIVTGAATSNAITAVPTVLTTNVFPTVSQVTTTRRIQITGGQPSVGAFTFDNTGFSLDVVNHTVNFNAVEQWTIANTNNPIFSHSFHIHDVQFYLIGRTGGTGSIAPYEQGWKDTVYVQQGATVTFLAKFDTFASYYNPFMYHCHFSDHEDAGLMGQFLVLNNAVEDLAIASFTRIGTNQNINLQFNATPGTTYMVQYSPNLDTSSWTNIGYVTSTGTSANFVETSAARLAQTRGFYRVGIPVNSY